MDEARLKEIEELVAHVRGIGWRDGSAYLEDVLDEDIPALVAEVRRLRDAISMSEEGRRQLLTLLGRIVDAHKAKTLDGHDRELIARAEAYIEGVVLRAPVLD